jgi:hypothetical protein
MSITRLIVLIIFTSCATLSTVSLLVSRTADLLANPFTPYTDLLGKDGGAVLARGFECRMADYADLPGLDCIRAMPSGTFSSVEILIRYGIVERINVHIRDGEIRAGDLAHWCGMSAMQSLDVSQRCWSNAVAARTLPEAQGFSYFTPLTSLSFWTAPL